MKKKYKQLGCKEWFWRLGLSGVGGAAIFLAFPTFDLWILAWVALVAMLWAARGTSRHVHFLLGLWAGSIANLGGFYWIVGMLRDFGHMPMFLAIPIFLLLIVYQGLVFGLWLYLVHCLERYSHFGMWLVAPISLVVAESVVWFIFPWYYANSQYKIVPIIQICELGGVSLLSFVLGATNGALFDALVRWKQSHKLAIRSVILALTLPLLCVGFGIVRIRMVDSKANLAPKLVIGVVEADVGINEKEEPLKVQDNLVLHQRMSKELERKGAELIIWPETAYNPRFVYARERGKNNFERFRVMPRDVAAVSQSALIPPLHASDDAKAHVSMRDRVVPQRGFQTPLLFGVLTFRPNPNNQSVCHQGVDFFNTALLLDNSGNVLGAYDKVNLLVFGEYIPLGKKFPFLYKWIPEAGELTKGKNANILQFGRFRIGVMICYEDILPRFSRDIALGKPNVLVNITNDDWFGKTSEPYLHMALAIFRAIENRVPLVRVTNTGVSCFVDPVGRIKSETKLSNAETLLEQVPMMKGGSFYLHLGDWPVYLCVLAVVGIWIRSRRKRHNYTARS